MLRARRTSGALHSYPSVPVPMFVLGPPNSLSQEDKELRVKRKDE